MSDWVKSLSKVLYIDLTRKIFWVEDREDLFSKWLGGIGVAVQLYKEEVPKGADPLAPENAIIMAVGPATGVFPMASKTIAVFKSPLNGYIAESHAGGRSAAAIRFAGYGAIVIKGASDRPV
ncbi:MAG: aldehyde ferredoxin oxidoreductase N-terminal domain-containing protein, partial [Sulfolobales archaeon]